MAQKCTSCKKTVSHVSLVTCSECGEKICRDCSYTCVGCDTTLCESCIYTCESCGEPLCPNCAIVTGDEDHPNVFCEECNDEIGEDYFEESEIESNCRYRSFQKSSHRW